MQTILANTLLLSLILAVLIIKNQFVVEMAKVKVK